MDITSRIDAVTKIGQERISMGGIQAPPKSVKIEITSKCDLRCKYCAVRTRKKQSNKDMDFDFFRKITYDMRMNGVEEIGVFYLGESFMAPDLLIKCVEWCKKELEFPWVFLTSNATVAFNEHVKAVMRAGLDSLKWSVNYNSYAMFNEITGGTEKQYFHVLNNIDKAWEIRKKGNYKTLISASSILYDSDYQKNDITQEFLSNGVIPYIDRLYWLPMYQMSMYKKDVEESTGYIPTMGNMGRIDDKTMIPNRPSLPCWAVFTEGHVRVDGGFSACCFGADGRFDMGSLNGYNFMKVWNSAKFIELRKAQLKTILEGPMALMDTPCKVCVAYEGK